MQDAKVFNSVVRFAISDDLTHDLFKSLGRLTTQDKHQETRHYLTVASSVAFISSSAISCWVPSTCRCLFSSGLRWFMSTESAVYMIGAVEIMSVCLFGTDTLFIVFGRNCSVRACLLGVCDTSGVSRSLGENSSWKSSSTDEWSWWQTPDRGRAESGWTESKASTLVWAGPVRDMYVWHWLEWSVLEPSAPRWTKVGLANIGWWFTNISLSRWRSGT